MSKTRVTEGKAIVDLPENVFYNPVQEFNRDMSIAAISTFCKSKTSVTIFEALSASAIRSVRYAKEIPIEQLRIVANDLDPNAVKTIESNIELNQLQDKITSSCGDANMVMYGSLGQKDAFTIVDLDPYGSAIPFLDAAVRSVANEGLLCVTCTDMAVLAGGHLSETCFAKYGGISIPNVPFCHEMGLRLLLNAIQMSAAKYDRAIVPVLSCSIDFYIRVFVKVIVSPQKRKLAASQSSLFFYCHGCKSFATHALGKIIEREQGMKYGVNPLTLESTCPVCDGRYQIGGPIYSGPLHDKTYVNEMLSYVKENRENFGTNARMIGMLSVISEELDDLFYYTIKNLCHAVHCTSPPIVKLYSALLHLGYKVSSSHANSGSIKTNAPPTVMFDIIRHWVKLNPVKNIKDGDPAANILAKEPSIEVNFEKHPDALSESRKIKLVRYQTNPTENWGPKAKASKKRANQSMNDAKKPKMEE